MFYDLKWLSSLCWEWFTLLQLKRVDIQPRINWKKWAWGCDYQRLLNTIPFKSYTFVISILFLSNLHVFTPNVRPWTNRTECYRIFWWNIQMYQYRFPWIHIFYWLIRMQLDEHKHFTMSWFILYTISCLCYNKVHELLKQPS